MKSGNLSFLEPSGLLQACNGTDLPLYCRWLLEIKRPILLIKCLLLKTFHSPHLRSHPQKIVINSRPYGFPCDQMHCLFLFSFCTKNELIQITYTDVTTHCINMQLQKLFLSFHRALCRLFNYTHQHMHTYIYIYACVGVCVCVHVLVCVIK